MPNWQIEGEYHNAPTFPMFDPSESLEFTLTFVNDTDEAYQHAYLFTDEEFIGMIFCRLPGETEWNQLWRTCDPEAWIGECIVGGTDIEFRIIAKGGFTDCFYYPLPIYMAHDDGSPLPNNMFHREFERDTLWLDSFDPDFLWWNTWKFPLDAADPVAGPSNMFRDDYSSLWADDYTRPVWNDGYA